MTRIKVFGAFVLASLIAVSCQTEPISTPGLSTADLKTGNDAPNGAHYNLNIIGVPKDKTADMTGNNGHRIFVKLYGKSKINLIEGDDFAVLDANGTDNDGASFQLPNPDPDGDGTTEYSIWARPLGTPGGSASIYLCGDADLTDGYYEVCTTDPLEVTRSKGPSKFKDVTKQLLTILVPDDITFTDSNGVEQTIKAGRYTIFDDTFEDYFWQYDNDGLKLLQLRFYEVPSTIN